MPSDAMLLAYVQRVINSGMKQVELPGDLASNARRNAPNTVGRPPKLRGEKVANGA